MKESKITSSSDVSMGVQQGGLEEMKIAGGSIVDDKPVFSAGSKFLFVVNDGKVHAYNAATGELAHLLETKSPIVAVYPDASNHRHVTTCDSEANIILWDFPLGTSLKKRSFAALTSDGSAMVGLLRPAGAVEPYVLLRRSGTDDSADLVRPVKNATLAQEVVRGVRRGTAGRWEVAFGGDGRMVAALVKADTILVRNLWQKESAKTHQYNTCDRTAPVPSPAWRVTDGDVPGEWRRECVLVYWHGQDEQPAFLPRLGMPIRHVTVSPDNQLVPRHTPTTRAHALHAGSLATRGVGGVVTPHIIAASDLPPLPAVIRLVSAQRQVTQLIRGLSWGAGAGPATGLVLEPRCGALLLNGAVGHLQLFSPHDRRDLYSIDVVQTNYLTRERTGAPVTCDVTRAAVTSDGGWMATLEERDDGRTTPERRLKFWRFDAVQQSYALNTCVDDPHDSTLTALEFQPGPDAKVAPLAVTTGTDGAIKYWCLVDDSDIYSSKSCWSCDAVGSHRRLPAGCAAFSADGARLAVGFAAAVTVWAPDRNLLLHTLSNVTLRDDVRQVVFGRGQCCHLLVARADSGLRVWNLETLTLTARIDLRVTLLIPDPGSEYMAAFSATNKVFVFRPSSTRPVHQAALGRRVSAACFVPHKSPRPELPQWQRASQLFFLNDQQALHTLDLPGADAVPTAGDVISGHVTPTPFSALVAEQRRSAVTPGQLSSQSEVTPGLQQMLEMLEAPSHTLPPLTRLCSPFLEAMLYPRDREPDEPMEEASAADTAAAPETATAGRAAPSLDARLDHLLVADMSWLAV
ncbi:WD repeat-containing protein 75-like [Pollicipes pollicipes]|uniref:WD repeat-containing protein 75-like n=1 Tax=Pollicipes pollicipes TaxID=41117 RepID=UPI0018853DFD|nr:WD repeat-containing protein 75-like [Pollicipes pollicipes]